MIFGMTGRTASKLFVVSFTLGAGMEMFMIQTGFYNIVTRYAKVAVWMHSTIECACLLGKKARSAWSQRLWRLGGLSDSAG